jgi:hypothetical protein
MFKRAFVQGYLEKLAQAPAPTSGGYIQPHHAGVDRSGYFTQNAARDMNEIRRGEAVSKGQLPSGGTVRGNKLQYTKDPAQEGRMKKLKTERQSMMLVPEYSFMKLPRGPKIPGKKRLKRRAAPLAKQGFARGYLEKLAELGWANDDRAQVHAKKHSAKMHMTPEQYFDAARGMLDRREEMQPIKDKMHRGDMVYWDRKTGQKLVLTPQGHIRTFYNAGARP